MLGMGWSWESCPHLMESSFLLLLLRGGSDDDSSSSSSSSSSSRSCLERLPPDLEPPPLRRSDGTEQRKLAESASPTNSGESSALLMHNVPPRSSGALHGACTSREREASLGDAAGSQRVAGTIPLARRGLALKATSAAGRTSLDAPAAITQREAAATNARMAECRAFLFPCIFQISKSKPINGFGSLLLMGNI
jgi:hypothetical protein